MASLYAIIFEFAIVFYGCILCAGLPLGRAANPVEWDMSSEFTSTGVNITDLPIPLKYCAQQYPENTSPASFDVHNQVHSQEHDQWITLQNNLMIVGIVLAVFILILVFLVCFRKLQVYCCMSLEQGEISGIPNIGNTCFMNAVLQVLCWTSNFKEQLQKATEVIDLQSHETREQGFVPRIDKSLLKLVDSVRAGETVKQSLPNDILTHVRQLNDRFEGHNQQDSYELFNTIIAGLEDLIEERCDCGDQTEQLMNRSPVSRLLGGVFFTVFTFESCNHTETTFQRFTSIPVQILSNNEKTIVRVIRIWRMAYNYLLRFRKVLVQIFAEPVRRLELEKDTDFNAIRLKDSVYQIHRFQHGDQKQADVDLVTSHTGTSIQQNEYGQLRKIDESLSYPEYLDVAPFCSSALDRLDDHQTAMYRLYGVVCHTGSIKGGHYTSRVRTTEHLKTDFLTQEWQDPEKKVEKILSFWKDKQFVSEDDDLQSGVKTDAEGEKERINPENKNDSRLGNVQSESDKWYTISDTFVKRYLQDDALRESDAYMLMYERVYMYV